MMSAALCGAVAVLATGSVLAAGAQRERRDPPRQVTRIYWEMQQTTEVRVHLVPPRPDGAPARVDLTFQAFFPGRALRDWNTGQPQWPTGAPARITVTAQAFPLTFAIPELSLRLVVDGSSIDLTAPGSRYRNIPCLIASDGCAPNGVEAELEPGVLRSLIAADTVRGLALGFPIELTKADRAALAEFASRIGVSPDGRPRFLELMATLLAVG
jgi:hypothetical protein